MTVPPGYPSLNGKRVLVIEKDDQLHHALAGVLEDAGCETFCLPGSTAEIGLLLPRRHMDAALLDIALGAHWIQLAGSLADSGVPLLLLCADRADEVTDQFHARWLQKPFTEQQLLSSMSSVLDLDIASTSARS